MKLKYSLYIVIILNAFEGKFIHGEHKSRLLGIKECENPYPPKCKSEVIEGKFGIFGKSDRKLINGSVIVKKDIITFLNFRSGVEKNGKLKNYNLSYSKLTCKNLMMKVVLAAVNIKYNEDTCEIFKGNYYLEGIDINILDHAVNIIPIREPGINNWYLNFFGNEGTFVCIILRVELTVLKSKPQRKSNKGN